jgi:hypothetical protein
VSGRTALAITGYSLAAWALAACASAGLPQADCADAARVAEKGGPGARCLPTARLRQAKSAAPEIPVDQYCTPESGFAAGLRGEAYAGLCDGAAAQRFLAEHRKGERLNDLTATAQTAERAASDAAAELWRIKRRIMQVETMRLSYSTPRDQRAKLYAEAKSLVSQKEQYEAELDRLVADKDAAEAALAAYRAEIAPSLAALDKPTAATPASY